MGRPLNKKFFGNRNIGTTGTTTDDKIGGGAVATFTVATRGTYQARPTATVTSFFPGGVTATGTTTLEVELAVVTAGGGAGAANYITGDIVTVTTASGVATFTVTADVDGVVTAAAPLSRGTFAGVLATGAQATTTNSVAGAGCTLTLTYRVLSIQVGTAGSGHKVGSTVTITGANTGQAATATVATIAVDTGLVGSATNQENAIVIRAKIDSEATVRIGDIIKQSSARRYKVKTTDGIAICKLVADDTPATFEAYIKATDANGNTYFVMKLTSKLAVLKQWTNNETTWLFEDNARAHWTFSSSDDSYDEADSVVIENA
jgi:hypothetical protein